VLISGETGGTTAKTVFAGLGVGAIFALGYKAFGLFKDVPNKIFGKAYAGGNVELEVGPELMGVGYIIGTRIAMIMGAGGILSSLVLMPAIKLFGSASPTAIYPATGLIKDMSTNDIWRAYILYIGAGAVGAGGIISLFKSLPPSWAARCGECDRCEAAVPPPDRRGPTATCPCGWWASGR